MLNALRPLVGAVATAFAILGCVSVDPPATQATLRVKPLLSVRHGMSAAELYRTGRALHEQGRDDEAIAAFRLVLMTDPTHVDAFNALGVVYSLQGRAAAAEEMFRTAISLAPEAAYLRENLAHHLARDGAAPPAIAAASEAAPELPSPEPASETPRVEPAQAVPPISPPAAPIAGPPGNGERHRVEVANGNGTAGLARRMSRLLPPDEFTRARLTNDKPFGRLESVIQHVEGAEAVAEQVNAVLPARLPLARVERLERRAEVRVLLGKDFPTVAPAVLVAAR